VVTASRADCWLERHESRPEPEREPALEDAVRTLVIVCGDPRLAVALTADAFPAA